MEQKYSTEELERWAGILRENGYTVTRPLTVEERAIAFLRAGASDGRGHQCDLLGLPVTGRKSSVAKMALNFFLLLREKLETRNGRNWWEIQNWEILVAFKREDFLAIEGVGERTGAILFGALATLGLDLGISEEHPLIKKARRQIPE